MNLRLLANLIAAIAVAGTAAHAGFHQVEVEQIVGGINGDAAALAIQLRLRVANQHQFGTTNMQLRLWNAAGTTSAVLGTLTMNAPNSTSGARVLLTTPAFDAAMASVAGYSSNYSLGATFPIAFPYLDGGKLTFERVSDGTVYWSLAFGAYTGTNSGNSTNGTFGSPFASSVPTDGRGILYQSGTAASTNNATQYAFTTGRASVTNAAGTSFLVVPEPGALALLGFGTVGLAGLVYSRRRAER